MKKETIAIVVVVLLLVLGALYVFKKRLPRPIIVTTNQTTTPYYCREGTIIASYENAGVTLMLSDGRSLTLPQAVSGSGVRYELGSIVFWNKGDTATLSENNAPTYSNCVSGTQTSIGTTNMYTDTGKTFSFSYPNTFSLYGGDGSYDTNWSGRSTDLGILLTVVAIPKSFQPGTNFSEAKFTVGVSSDPKAVANCQITGVMNGDQVPVPVNINGISYKKLISGDAGAGNFYENTSYRTVRNGQCYAIEYTIHSTNIGNYSPDQNIKEFDKAKVTNTLESIVQSFKFI